MKKIYLLLGILVTMPIVGIKIGGRVISLFYITFIIFNCSLIFEFINNRGNFKLNKVSKILLVWFFMAIISGLCGVLYLGYNSIWGQNIIRYIFNLIIYIIILLLIGASQNKKNILDKFLQGFILGIILNILWGILEGILYYSFKFRLNDYIFTNLITLVDRDYLTVITQHGIRAAGFNIDPAHLGALIPIIILKSIIERKYFLLLISIVGLIFSQSTTGLVVSIILVISNLKYLDFKIKKNLLKKFIIIIVISIVSIVIFKSNVFEPVRDNMDGFINRIEYKQSEHYYESKRVVYHKNLINSIYYNGLKSITGMGLGTSGYAYVNNPEVYWKMSSRETFAYDVESTYLAYILDLGIVGIIIYLIIIFSIYFKYRRFKKSTNNIILVSAIGSIIYSGLFYHYILTSYQILIIILACININKGDKDEEYNVINSNSKL